MYFCPDRPQAEISTQNLWTAMTLNVPVYFLKTVSINLDHYSHINFDECARRLARMLLEFVEIEQVIVGHSDPETDWRLVGKKEIDMREIPDLPRRFWGQTGENLIRFCSSIQREIHLSLITRHHSWGREVKVSYVLFDH
jgi:hypothetical protein